MTPNSLPSNRAEQKQLCLTDPIYLSEQLGYDLQEDVHRPLFDALQSGKDKRLILWPRGHYKTTAVVVFLVQCILNNPDIRILVMQATLKLTKGWVREIRSHFDGKNAKSKLPQLFPEFCVGIHGDAFGFTCPARTRKHLKETTVTAASPRAVQTGQHYDLFAPDDLVNSANFRNVELLDKLESEFYHFLPLLDPGGRVVMTGTRYSFADIYQRIITKHKLALAADIDEWEISIRKCYKEDGSLLFSQRVTKDGRKIGFTLELLASLKFDDPEMFAPQYLNEAVAAKDQLFPASLILSAIHPADDEFIAYRDISYPVMMVDLAEGKNPENDYSAVAVGYVDPRGRVWIMDVLGGILPPHALVNLITMTWFKYRPRVVKIEKQPGATFFEQFLLTVARDRGIRLSTELVPVDRTKGAKHIRIASLENPFKQKRLLLLPGITKYTEMQEHFEQFPRGRRDDYADVVALLYSELAKNVTFRPVLKPRNFIFDVPHSTENLPGPVSPLGSGFCG